MIVFVRPIIHRTICFCLFYGCFPSESGYQHCILKGMYKAMNELFNRTCLTGETEEHSLPTLLENSKKNRIKSVASRYGVKLSDKNTKQQMTQAASPVIEVNFGIKLKQYAKDELALLLDCFRHSEVSEETAAAIASSAPFEDGGVYLIAKKDKYYPVIPIELAGKIMSRCVSHYFGGEESELSRTAKACARIYGTFTASHLAGVVNAAYGANVTGQEAEQYLSGAQTEEFTYADGLAAYTLGSPAAVSELAENLDYDLPSRKEIEAYAFYGLDTSDYYYRQIVNLVYNNAGNSFDKANELMRFIANWCVTDGQMPSLLQAIEQAQLTITQQQFNFILDMVGELAAKTRRQSLKGHRYNEVEGTAPIVMPQIQVVAAKPEPVKIAPKIGRNDPCPCGSGKKYKKCCGRNQ